MAEPAFKRFGKYEIQDELGRGGFGRVFRAFDPTVGRLVAIKILTSEAGADLLTRFRNEATAAGNLRHENIVTIYELGEENGVPFIVMEYLDGEDLAQTIAAGKALSLLEKVSIMAQTAAGLDCAHRHGVVHRDVKPANIRLLPDGTVKIMDFGIARLIREDGAARLTRQGHVIGTLLYMSPEQVVGSDTDSLCDIFAFGVTFYELLTGKHPFRADDPRSIFYKITSEDPELVHEVVPQCPDTLGFVIRRALNKDRELRYQTLRDLKLDIEPVLMDLRRSRAAMLVDEAQKLLGEHGLERARALLNEAIDLEPGNQEARRLRDSVQTELRRQLVRPRIEALITKATQSSVEGNYADALQMLDAALRLDPEDVTLKARASEVQQQRDQSRELIRLISEARADLAQRDLASALRKASDAAALNPKSIDARALVEIIQGEIKKEERARKLEARLTEAEGHVANDLPDEALAILTALDAEERNAPEVLSLGARIAARRSELARAQELRKQLGEVRELVQTGRFVEAIPVLKRLRLDLPEEAEPQELLVRAQRELAAQEKAQAVARTLGEIERLLDNHRPEDAARELERALAKYPDDALRAALTRTNDSIRAKQQARVLAQLESEVRRCLEKRDFDRALKLIENAPKPIREETAVANLKADVLGEKAACEEAETRRREELAQKKALEARRAVFEKAVKRCNDLIRKGRIAEAEASVEAAEREFPEEPEVQTVRERLRVESKRVRRREEVRRVVENATTLVSRGETRQAIELLTMTLTQYPEEPTVESALKSARQTENEQQRTRVVQAVCRETRACLDRKDFERALETVEVNLATLSGDPTLIAMRETVIAERRDFEREIERAPETDAKPRKARTRLGKLALAGGALGIATAAAALYFIRPSSHAHPPVPAQVQVAPQVAKELSATPVKKSEPITTEGTLVIETNADGASIRLDGKELNQETENGRLTLPLEPRAYVVAVEKQGYRVIPERLIATIRSDEPFRAVFRLEPKPAVALISGVEEGATVLIDGSTVGNVRGRRFSVDVAPGRHTVELTKAGFRTASTQAFFKPGETVEFRRAALPLEALPSIVQKSAEQQPQTTPQPVAQAPPKLPAPVPADTEASDWIAARSANSSAAMQAFLNRYPNSARRSEALELLTQLDWNAVDHTDRAALKRFAEQHDGTALAQQAAAELKRMDREAMAAAATKKADEQASADRQEIAKALALYATAFERKDLALLKSIWPGLPESALAQAFRGKGTIRSQLRPLRPAELAEDRATVHCLRTTEQSTQFGRQKPVEDARTVHLRRDGVRWVISAID